MLNIISQLIKSFDVGWYIGTPQVALDQGEKGWDKPTPVFISKALNLHIITVIKLMKFFYCFCRESFIIFDCRKSDYERQNLRVSIDVESSTNSRFEDRG